jgi:nardilysin
VLESFNTNDSNSIITNYYQCGPFTIKDSVIIEILMLIIKEPLFDTLRTKEQLGYDVSCSNRDTFGVLGFSITVNAQATKNSTEHVDRRIEEFVKQASQLLKDMSSETFETTKKDLIKMKRCTDVHLKEEFDRNWSEIADEDYMFDRLKQEIAEIEKLEFTDVQNWWEAHTLCGNKDNFRKLSIQIVGSKNPNENTKKPESREDENKNPKLSLNFLDRENKDGEQEGQPQNSLKSVADFKENLYLYPVMCKYTVKN